jgi:BASS family bile acid:Na+ symporter
MDSPLTLIGLPIALGIIMLGLGLGLVVDDFRRVGRHPKAAVIALLCQLVLLPAICFGLVVAFGLSPELAVGMMLLAASPGGTTANLYSHLFGGNVALNITLTAINSLLAVVTLPVVVNLSAAYFLTGDTTIGLQFDKVLQVFAIVLVPVAIGMLVRSRAPSVAERLNRPVRVLSVVVLVVVIAGAVYGERENIASYFVSVGLTVLAFNVLSLLIGYGVPRLSGVERRAATAPPSTASSCSSRPQPSAGWSGAPTNGPSPDRRRPSRQPIAGPTTDAGRSQILDGLWGQDPTNHPTSTWRPSDVPRLSDQSARSCLALRRFAVASTAMRPSWSP